MHIYMHTVCVLHASCQTDCIVYAGHCTVHARPVFSVARESGYECPDTLNMTLKVYRKRVT